MPHPIYTYLSLYIESYYTVHLRVFSQNFWWGNLFSGTNFQSPSGTESDGGGGELTSGTESDEGGLTKNVR